MDKKTITFIITILIISFIILLLSIAGYFYSTTTDDVPLIEPEETFRQSIEPSIPYYSCGNGLCEVGEESSCLQDCGCTFDWNCQSDESCIGASCISIPLTTTTTTTRVGGYTNQTTQTEECLSNDDCEQDETCNLESNTCETIDDDDTTREFDLTTDDETTDADDTDDDETTDADDTTETQQINCEQEWDCSEVNWGVCSPITNTRMLDLALCVQPQSEICYEQENLPQYDQPCGGEVFGCSCNTQNYVHGYGLQHYPQPIIINDILDQNTALVIDDNALASDTLAAADILAALQFENTENLFPEIKLASEITDLSQNLIFIWNLEQDSTIEQVISSISNYNHNDWTLNQGKGLINIIENGNHIAIIVAGTTSDDLRIAAETLANSQENNLCGTLSLTSGETYETSQVDIGDIECQEQEISTCTKVEIDALAQNIEDSSINLMDEGLYNILKWGYISLDGEDFDETNYDYCDGDSLNEYYCDGDQPTPLEILCEHGCISPTGQYDYLGKCAEPEETYQCGDGIDNDGDGLIDLDDPECLTPEDNDESDEEEETEEPEEIAICTKVEIEILAQNIEDSTVINMDAGLYDTQKWGYISLNEEGYTQDSSSDHCHGNSLNEYYCDGNQPILLATSCEYGCVSEEQYGYNFGKCAGGEEPEEEEPEEEEEEETYRCNDGYDNDNDGKVDLDDPGCTTPTDDDERNDCGDGYDNDNDGYTDLEELFVCEDESGLYEGESQKAAGNLINAILKILGVS